MRTGDDHCLPLIRPCPYFQVVHPWRPDIRCSRRTDGRRCRRISGLPGVESAGGAAQRFGAVGVSARHAGARHSGASFVATLGHTLRGLSLGGLCRTKSRNDSMPYVWMGLVILFAHLVDFVEWAFLFLAPPHFDKHSLTHSPLLVFGMVVLVWLGMRFFTRIRRPLPYVIVALSIMSHLLLDHWWFRSMLVAVSGQPLGEAPPGLVNAVVAELWLFGLLFVCVLLFQACRQRDCPRKGRVAGVILGILAVGGAATRHPLLWVPAYVLAATHAIVLLRRQFKLRLLWSIVPLIPLAVLLVVHATVAWYVAEAKALQKKKDYAGAIALYEQAISIPTRQSYTRVYVELGWCYQKIGQLEKAEAALLESGKEGPDGFVPDYYLARFYSDANLKGTPYFRPQKAKELLLGIQNGPDLQGRRYYAVRLLARLRDRGLIE